MDALRFHKKLENDGEIVLTGLPGKKGKCAQVAQGRAEAEDVAVLLVDTDVMVDVLRCHQPAEEWLKSHASEDVAIPGFVLLTTGVKRWAAN